MPPPPTSRWFKQNDRVEAHAQRREYAAALLNGTRAVFNHSGRRSWKTETAKRALVALAMRKCGKRFLVGAPTFSQCRRVYWNDFKAMIPPEMIASKSESDMTLNLVNGTTIACHGMDSPNRVEGSIWDLVLLDEYGNMKPRILGEVISPMLADTKGPLWCIGVPEGRNHYYDTIQDVLLGKWGESAKVFHWPSWEIMDAEQIELEEGKLDALTYSQEYGGEFVDFAGRAYYAFSLTTHTAPLHQLYDPNANLVLCFDFNVDPGVAVICQERNLPSGLLGTAVIGEVYVPKNSNTEVVARKILADWGREGLNHQGTVSLYGDFTGGARGSSQLQGSDWEIIKRILRQQFDGRIRDKVTVNPLVRDRINSVNSRLKAVNGDIRLMVDPKHALYTAKDLEGVTLLQGSAGEIDKASSPLLTHLSDALGYYISAEFGFRKHTTIVTGGSRIK